MSKSFRIPDTYWFRIEDGHKESPCLYTLSSLLEYIHEHDFSCIAVVYWMKSFDHGRFETRGGMFLEDFLSSVYG